ncbi:Y box binding protein 1 [Allomyces javanicus]|nr:Y box binding protein 1 [Allomyces javanicus]
MSDLSTSAGPAAPPTTPAPPGTPPTTPAPPGTPPMPSTSAPMNAAAPTTPVRGPSPLGPPRTPNAPQYASSPHLMRARRGGSGSPSRAARMYPGSPRGRSMQSTGAYDRFASDRSAAAHYGYAPAAAAWGPTYAQDTDASDGGRTGGEPLGRRTGRVKFFNSQKGYGFIIPDEPLEDLVEQEVFVHHTAIANHTTSFRSLAEDESVEFDLIRGTKGYYSQNVTGPAGSPVIGDVKPSYHHHHHHHHHGGHHHRKGSHGSPLRRNIASPARAQAQHDGIPVATLSVTLPDVSQPGSGAPATAVVPPSMTPGAIPTYPAMPGAPIPPGVPFLVMHNGQWYLVPPNAYAPYPAPPPPPMPPAPGSDASPSLPPTDASAAGSPMIGANFMYPRPHGSPAAVAAAPAPYFLPYGYPAAAAMAIPPPDAPDAAGMSPMLAPYGMPRPATPPFPPGIRSPGMDALDAQFHHMHLVDRRSSAGSLPGSPVVAPVPPPGMVPFPMAAAPGWFPPPPLPMVVPAGIPPHAGAPVVQQPVPQAPAAAVAGPDAAAAAAAAPAAEGGAVVAPPRVEEELSGDASLADDYF